MDKQSIEGLSLAGLDILVNTIISIKLKNDQDRIIKEIENFSNEQRLEIEKKLKEAKDESERISILMKSIAVAKNQKSLDQRAKNKTKNILIVTTLFTILTGIIIYKRRK